MSADILTLVLMAALFHALWNAVVRCGGQNDHLWMVMIGQTLCLTYCAFRTPAQYGRLALFVSLLLFIGVLLFSGVCL